jgi:hypothetical protein
VSTLTIVPTLAPATSAAGGDQRNHFAPHPNATTAAAVTLAAVAATAANGVAEEVVGRPHAPGVVPPDREHPKRVKRDDGVIEDGHEESDRRIAHAKCAESPRGNGTQFILMYIIALRGVDRLAIFGGL